MKIIEYIIGQKNKDINGKTIVSSKFLIDQDVSFLVNENIQLYNNTSYNTNLSSKISFFNKSEYIPYNNNYKLSDIVNNFISHYDHKKDLLEYPTKYERSLKSLTKKFNLDNPESITFYKSSTESLNTLIKVFGSPKMKVLRFNPEWGTIDTIINNYNMIPEYISYINYKIDFDYLERYIHNNIKIIYLTYPNYPTGKCFSRVDFDKLVELVPKNIIIIVDQCYIEYSDCENTLPINYYIKKYINIIFTRTFSKFYGVPGIFGYTISNPKLARQLKPHNYYYMLSNFHDKLIEMIISDHQFNKSKKDFNKNEKKKMEDFLVKKNIKYIKSETNYMMIQFDFTKLGKLLEQTDRNKYPGGYYLYIMGSEKVNNKVRWAICENL